MENFTPTAVVSRAWYGALIPEFRSADPDAVFGILAKNPDFDLAATQKGAWLEQIAFLQKNLDGIKGTLYLEFNIPRMGSRVDAVLLIGTVVFVVEFKVGEATFDRAAIDQVWDYALDLKNFHEASHQASLVPILIATEAKESAPMRLTADADGVYHPMQIHPGGFRTAIEIALNAIGGSALDQNQWAQGAYRPTPTIVEAARALYAHHGVGAIKAFDAGKKNLGETSRRIEELIDEARAKEQKIICFLTGVPGAGKTLVGLNVATQHARTESPTHAVLLSGNGPLVAVLRAALSRDEKARLKKKGLKPKKSSDPVKQFIQNVHHFRDEALKSEAPPADHVVVFDEAQRAWNQPMTADFMKRKKGVANFTDSEPQYLIRYVDRHKDWAVILCLVGGGQEINRGESGIGAWLDAVKKSFPHWDMYISSRLTDSEYAAAETIGTVKETRGVYFDDNLHLSVSMRSFRAEHVSAFVKALLDCEQGQARETLAKLKRYPIAVTRNLALAKQWVRSKARGSERYGLVASSKAQRLKPHAIDIRVKTDPVHWFLDGKEDTRSSYYLEDVATEFQVQGLEVDWAVVTWDGDFRFKGSGWGFHDFRGAKWQNVKNPENQSYLKNAYRVLLTRARQGMVIFVPEGNPADHTRPPAHYDSTYQYLVDVGIPVLN
ncbi:MAG: DUF2075 domain-containing protein [Candidatus Didemnitutus sp.]|nr:DUF2075 domain-containing protein [Candidatus Didemnitutus sp.]